MAANTIPGRKFFMGEELYTDWVSRGGDDMFARAQIIDWDDNGGGGMTLRITVYTKDAEDAGHGEVVKDQAGTSELELILDPAAANPTKVKQLLVQSVASTSTVAKGLKELVRLKIEALDGATGEWIQIRLFAPVFFDRAAKP